MDYSNEFGRIINEIDDVSCAADACSKLCNKKIEKIAKDFADWLRYDDEIFSMFGQNKIGIDKLYNRFLDELKL